ncbi:hypothetical protein [Ruegeria sp. Ofav3-42]|uniref:hypothetical protein n=1 Tax=Ruegeria sp. Ofav3-42 TaxID=2917759 RepID=UPI001EF3FBF5|nr:hypothetical protein [Ruegeria sp. Ofav3-42]MCG7518323.1 hypothetical protein [Ruegeria sp. Ofav3-42]
MIDEDKIAAVIAGKLAAAELTEEEEAEFIDRVSPRRRAARFIPEEERQRAEQERAKKLRILHDIVLDQFDDTEVVFETRVSPDCSAISSFVVLHLDKEVRVQVVNFVDDALPKIGVSLIKWYFGDIFRVRLRDEPASAHEKMEMLRRLRDMNDK